MVQIVSTWGQEQWMFKKSSDGWKRVSKKPSQFKAKFKANWWFSKKSISNWELGDMVMTFPIKKSINDKLLNNGMATLYIKIYIKISYGKSRCGDLNVKI